MWGVAGTSFGSLLAYGLLFGAVAGGWTSLWSAVIREATPPSKDDGLSDTVTLFGWLSLSRGLGNVLSAPISSALISGAAISQDLGFGVDRGKYGSTILSIGVLMTVAGLIEIGNGFGGRRQRRR